MKRVLIAGGGVIGLTSAYYLSEAGHEVTVIDQFNFHNNCSPGNAGLIVPSHFIPLAAPGIVKQGIKWIFNAKSPFSMNFKPNLNLLKWALRFWYSSNYRHVQESAPILFSFNEFSKELYQDLYASLPEMDFKKDGLLMLCQTHKRLEDEYELADMAVNLGCEAKKMNIEEVRALQGNNTIDVKGGVYYPGDAHISPQKLAGSLLKLLEEKGVKLLPDVKLNKIISNGKIACKALTNKEEFIFDELVIATGAMSTTLFKQLKIPTLIQSGKGYSFENSKNDLLKVPAILTEARVAITPYSSYTRFAGAMEIGSLSLRIKKQKIQGMVQSILEYFPGFELDAPDSKLVWAGFRPCSFDGLPYIGRIAGINNVILATGHSMMGISLAPATGKIVSELVSGAPLSFDIKMFKPTR